MLYINQNRNNYYALNLKFSGMTISEGNIVEEGKREFYSSVKSSITRFVNRYKLNIEVKGETTAEGKYKLQNI